MWANWPGSAVFTTSSTQRQVAVFTPSILPPPAQPEPATETAAQHMVHNTHIPSIGFTLT